MAAATAAPPPSGSGSPAGSAPPAGTNGLAVDAEAASGDGAAPPTRPSTYSCGGGGDAYAGTGPAGGGAYRDLPPPGTPSSAGSVGNGGGG